MPSLRLPRLAAAAPALTAAVLATQALGSSPATADPSGSDWAKLRACESSGNYTVVSRSGHYFGAYQFDLGTWRSVGGSGRPDRALPAEQDYRALTLYRMRGWQPWTCGRGLPSDRDARSGRTPTRAEAAAVAGHSLGGGTGSTTAPAWGGVRFTYGDCDPQIRAFQLQLNRVGYHYTFQGTGCYVDRTRTAVRDLQRANGIALHDRLDKETWAAAFTGRAPR